MVQFEVVEPIEHMWPLVRTNGQIDKVLEDVKKQPGFVLYTIVNKALKQYLKKQCSILNIPCVSPLTRVTSDLSGYLGLKASHEAGKQHQLDEEYFSRVEAVNFALTHDDGQSSWDLEEADIVLVGASRTSKSPTCMYLAHRGYRVANIPFVPGSELPGNLDQLTEPLIVGLTISPKRLVQIRKNRMLSIKSNTESLYTDLDEVDDEVKQSRRLFSKHHWPVIDVSRRSVEETAAQVIKLFNEHRKK